MRNSEDGQDTSETTEVKQDKPRTQELNDRMTYDVDAIQNFLNIVFHSQIEADENILVWSVKHTPKYPESAEVFLERFRRVGAPRALYFGTSTCHADPEDGVLYNRQNLFERLHVVVLDDIGTKVPVKDIPRELEPTYIIETSKGNFQYGYVLEEPVANLDQAKALVRLVYGSGYSDKGGAMPTKLVRLPAGVNGKNDDEKRDFLVDLTKSNGPLWTPAKLLEVLDCGTTWEDIQTDASEALKTPKARNSTPWSPVELASPNTDGGVDVVLEWLYTNGYVKQETDEWVTIQCPWGQLHTDGENTAGYSPLGRGGFEYETKRGFHCFHDHCSEKKINEFLSWVASEDGPEVPVFDPSIHMVKEWVYDPANDCAWQVHGKLITNHSVKMAALRNLYPKKIMVPTRDGKFKPVSVVDLWIRSSHRVIVGGALFDPTTDAPLTKQHKIPFVNLFKRPVWGDVKPYDDDIEMFEGFIDYLIPNEEERKYFLDWLATKVTNPAFRGAGIIMCAEAQGTGRGTLASIIATLMGTQNVATLSFDKLIGTAEFNDWQMTPLVVVNETLDLGDKQFYRVYERLKGLIDFQPTEAVINVKFKVAQVTTIHSSYLMFSNHTGALSISEHDRRIVAVANAVVPESPAFFRKLYTWKDEKDDKGNPPWAPSVYNWLKARDVDIAALYEHAPDTDAKRDMREATRNPLDVAVREITRQWDGDIIAYACVYNVVVQLLTRLGLDGKNNIGAMVKHRMKSYTTPMHQSYRCLAVGKRVRPKIITRRLTPEKRKLYKAPDNITETELTDIMNNNKHEQLLHKVQNALDELDI